MPNEKHCSVRASPMVLLFVLNSSCYLVAKMVNSIIGDHLSFTFPIMEIKKLKATC